MLVKSAKNRGPYEFVSLEDMVPQDHLLRKIDAAIAFKKIYEFVEDLYGEDNGRPSVGSVVLFKIVLVPHRYTAPPVSPVLFRLQTPQGGRSLPSPPVSRPAGKSPLSGPPGNALSETVPVCCDLAPSRFQSTTKRPRDTGRFTPAFGWSRSLTDPHNHTL